MHNLESTFSDPTTHNCATLKWRTAHYGTLFTTLYTGYTAWDKAYTRVFGSNCRRGLMTLSCLSLNICREKWRSCRAELGLCHLWVLQLWNSVITRGLAPNVALFVAIRHIGKSVRGVEAVKKKTDSSSTSEIMVAQRCKELNGESGAAPSQVCQARRPSL